MSKNAVLQIVTANHLLGGHSVFMGPDGWTADHCEACIARTPAEAAALELRARADETANRVVGVYRVDVEMAAGGLPEPIHYREKLRVRARPSFWADVPAAYNRARHSGGTKTAEAAHVLL